MVRKPGLADTRIVMLAGAAAALLVSGCTVAVDRQETTRVRMQTAESVFNPDRPESPQDLPVYPGAKAVRPLPPSTAGVSFTGRYADTRTYSSHFATDYGVDVVLQFYRDALRKLGAPVECRGTINVQARGRTEELRCIPRGASDAMQLAVAVPGHHAVVRVAPAVTGSTFTLVNVRTRH
jgi:hypothetical protein